MKEWDWIGVWIKVLLDGWRLNMNIRRETDSSPYEHTAQDHINKMKYTEVSGFRSRSENKKSSTQQMSPKVLSKHSYQSPDFAEDNEST